MTKHLQPTPQAARRKLPIAQSVGLVWRLETHRNARGSYQSRDFAFKPTPLWGALGVLRGYWIPVYQLANLVRLTKGFGNSGVRLNLNTGVSHD